MCSEHFGRVASIRGGGKFSLPASVGMGRLRNEIAGAIYHVVARGVDRRRIFVDDEDYRTYIRLLATVARRQGWHLLCFCLMPNHVHLLIETPDTNLGDGMQWLQSRYAIEFNRRHHRYGCLFETRYKSPMVTSEAALLQTVGYIVLNPVAAVLCKAPDDWPWASHAVIRPDGSAPGWLAHERLLTRIEATTGSPCYDRLIATRALAA